jgi:hypothetical protein
MEKTIKKHKHLLYKSIRRVADVLGIILLLVAILFVILL